MLKLTDPKASQSSRTASCSIRTSSSPSQVQYPADYLAKWDAETQTHRLTGVAANDCHHNYS